MRGLDVLNGSAAIFAGDIDSRAVVIVSKKLSKCQARVMMGIKVFRSKLPGMRIVGFKVGRRRSSYQPAASQWLQKAFGARRAAQFVGSNDKGKLDIDNIQIGVVAN